MPINPAMLMGQSLVEGIGTSTKPQTPAETKVAFIELLLDQVFLKSFMTEGEGIFSPEEDDLFNSSQQVSMYKDIVRKEMIHQLAEDEQFGFGDLFGNIPSLEG